MSFTAIGKNKIIVEISKFTVLKEVFQSSGPTVQAGRTLLSILELKIENKNLENVSSCQSKYQS